MNELCTMIIKAENKTRTCEKRKIITAMRFTESKKELISDNVFDGIIDWQGITVWHVNSD